MQTIEAPVRDTIPDGGPPVSDRNLGQEDLYNDFTSDRWNPDRKALGTKVGLVDAFRFTGAVPEVVNSRYELPPSWSANADQSCSAHFVQHKWG